MTQAVFVKMTVSTEELTDLVDAHPGLVHICTNDTPFRFSPLLTRAQKEERKQADLLKEMLLGQSQEEKTIDLNDALAALGSEEEPRPRYFTVFLRPPTKKYLKKAVTDNSSSVFVEETSVFGNEFEGFLDEAPEGRYTVVGPDPARRRSWFANIVWSDKKKSWLVR